MAMRRVNSQDVAREAGVSQSTVSLVLNGNVEARISEVTRQRVLEAAQRLNYHRNAAARALITGRTNRIGVVPYHPFCLGDHDSYYADVLAGVTDGALHFNVNLLLHSARYDHWQDLYQDILSGGEDGVLLIGRYPVDELTLALNRAQFPTVCVSSHPDCPPFYSVDCDNETGGYLAIQHLLTLGHRHIALIYPDDGSSWSRERLAGARRAIAEAGLPESYLTITSDIYTPTDEPVVRQVARLRNSAPLATAWFFVEEAPAQTLMEALPDVGLRVPEDIAIVSFNSTTRSARSHPPMTSVYQPLPEIGMEAVSLLMALIEGKEAAPGIRRLPVRLDVRASCGAPR